MNLSSVPSPVRALLGRFALVALLAAGCASETELPAPTDRAALLDADRIDVMDPGYTAPAPELLLSDEAAAAQGADCSDDVPCPVPLSCVSYFGIQGSSGPQFFTCELPCEKTACPAEQTCLHISDGPGTVCTP